MKKNSNIMVKGKVLAQGCPSREILQHLTNRWGTLVMIVLAEDKKRFSELRKQIEGISERMLTQTLQQLEQDGMINRKSYNTVPPHVEYSLTPHGKQAAEKLSDLVAWLENNLAELLMAKPAQVSN